MKDSVERLTRWLGESWTQAERDEEYDEELDIKRDAEARGLSDAGTTHDRIERMRARHHRQRIRLHVFAAIIVLVALCAFLAAFTSNRIVRGFELAGIATAAPVALYLGLRNS
jgi:hypothetical protein